MNNNPHPQKIKQIFMKQIVYTLLVGFLFMSCSHRIVRTGYQIKKSDYKNCEVVIRKKTELSDTLALKIGEIKLGETGISSACSEEHAIKILKNEACAMGADFIIITDENRPDLWSSCYRCNAGFYKYKSVKSEKIISNDVEYEPEKVKSRVSKDRKQNTIVAIGSVIVGILLGLLLL
jgi:preprotein translocase subunit SecF